MNGIQPENVDGFKEYRTKLANGVEVSAQQKKGHIILDNDDNNIDINII